MGWFALLLHLLLLAIAAMLMEALTRNVAAWRSGGLGPPAAQPVRDLVRLWRKPSVVPLGASFLFGAAPAVSLATAVAAGLLTPSFTVGMATGPAADLIVVAGLMALSRAAVGLAAYDSGSAPATYAGGQIMAAGLGIAPVLLLVALGATLTAGGTNLDALAASVRDGGRGQHMGGAVACAALLVLAGQEPGVLPGAWSGRMLALVTTAGMVRRVVALSLAAVLLPLGLAAAGAGFGAWVVGVMAWAVKLLVLGSVAAVLGPQRMLLPGAALLALIACVILGVQGSE